MAEHEIWMKKADQDLETAKFNKDNSKFEYAAFLYQQAVEKALKALIIAQDKGLSKTHDCIVLAKKVSAPKEIVNKADTVSPHYFRTRYPDTEGVELDKDISREPMKIL